MESPVHRVPARVLAAAVDDESVGQIVGGNGNGNAVAGNHFDVETPKTSADAGEKRVALVALHPKVPASESFHHASLNLDEIVSCHSEPFRRLPQQVARET